MTDMGGIVVERDLMVPARDGVMLATDVYRPDGPGPFPVLLERTPYDKSAPSRSERTAAMTRPQSRAEVAAYIVGHGYAVVYQDCRGRYHSGGRFTKYLSEAEDGCDALAWLVGQPWCNDRVGTFGLSYAAHTQAALGCLDPGVDRTADSSVAPRCGCWLFHSASALGCPRSLVDAKEPGTRPMCPGDPLGDHAQRAIALAVIFEPVLADEDDMDVSAPPPHQARARLQHAAGDKRASALLELSRQNPQAALQGAARAAMGALLQLIGEPPDDQIATEAQRRCSVMQCKPGTPQLMCRPIG